jgi:peptidoglycan/LPS O-acetylase OafA/YrhL
MTDVPPKARLFGIEAIRACAATMVVAYHVARHLDKAEGLPYLRQATQFGHSGVDLFFVVSGFIILFVHRRDIGRPSRLGHYLARRFSRVMPMYWIALSLTVLVSFAGAHAMPSLARLLWSALLLPSDEVPVLGVAWTLQYEILFYGLFCFLIINRSTGLLILAVWLGWILADWLGLMNSASIVPGSLNGPFNLEFFLGMGVAYWLGRGTVMMPRIILAVGLLLFAAAAMAEDAGIFDGYASCARLVYGIPSALLILGVVEAERSGKLSVPIWMRALGGASYSIYLLQFLFIGFAWKLWVVLGLDARMAMWAGFLFLVGAALAGGIGTAQLVERPLLDIVRGTRTADGVGLLGSKTVV